MGSHNHPCCEKTASQTSLVATVQQPHVLHVDLAAVTLVTQANTLFPEANSSRYVALGLPPPAPPNLNSILRI